MRRRLALMFAAAAALAAMVAIINYFVDPYGAYPIRLLDPIFRNLKQERLSTPYLVRSARPQTLLLGSSRVLLGMPIPQGSRDGVMNGALSAATIPQLSALVRLAVKNPGLKRIIWGVDFFAFDRNWNKDDPLFDRRIEDQFEQKVEDTIISASGFDDSFEMVKRALRGRAKLPPIATASVPWPPTLICSDLEARRKAGLAFSQLTSIQQQLLDDVPDYANFEFSQRHFELFRQSVNLARVRGIDVVIFIPPLNQYELEKIRLSGRWGAFQNFKRMLATIGPYVDFSGYNEISRSDWMFMHLMHFKSAVGETILRILMGQPLETCGTMPEIVARSAMRVDASSIDEALNAQEQMRRAVATDDSRYARLVATVLRDRRELGTAASRAQMDFAGDR